VSERGSTPAWVDAMQRADIDVLLLGREANARAVAATRRLWLAGTRSFSPTCVAVREPTAVHVLANSDDAVPDGFPREHLFGITWNPATLLERLMAIPGVASARRVGVDGMTPFMHSLLADALPAVTFVDAAPVLTELWRDHTAERVEAVRAAGAVARAGLDAMAAELRPGVRARMLRGTCAATFGRLGVTTPAFEGVAAPLERGGSSWLAPERLFDDGELVVLRAGALREGWEASLARTFRVGAEAHAEPPPAAWDDVIAACRAGVTAGDLRQRRAIVYGAGRGVEPWDDDYELTPGALVAVEVEEVGTNGARLSIRQDVVLVTTASPELLT
jgi:Xaa-Pro aminopeptidase